MIDKEKEIAVLMAHIASIGERVVPIAPDGEDILEAIYKDIATLGVSFSSVGVTPEHEIKITRVDPKGVFISDKDDLNVQKLVDADFAEVE